MSKILESIDVDVPVRTESTGDALGFVQRRAVGDLGRFKEFVEDRGVATGAWRGTVGQSDVSG